jgi:cysteine desulfurase / selenocysteine lyase
MKIINATDLPEARAVFRRQMKIVESYVYFDHAAVAPISTPARLAMSEYLRQVESQGDVEWREWANGVEAGRKQAARLVDCKPEEIAFIPNTTFGINVIANGIPWQPGDNLVVSDNEFPSNLLPWKLLARRGVEVRIILTEEHLDIDRMLEFVDTRTRVVAASWVHYASGYRVDLAELCERVQARGAKLFVDAIQGLGAFPLSVREIPIDFLAADGHKWMLGPEGAGILFVREEHIDWLEPIMMGWGSVQLAHDFSPDQSELKKQASRYEGGSANMVGLLGFSASVGVLLEAGCHQASSGMGDAILEMTGRLEDGLRSIGAMVFRPANIDRQSGIVSFELPSQESLRVRQQLLNEKIVLSVRHGRLRAAIHAYNIQDEVSRLVSTLSEI